jgi:DNA-binding NarL/FixJ family response regulator
MTRLLVVDDYEIVRAGLKQLLSEDKEFTVAGEAGSGADAVRMVRESDWDVVLLDISMPHMNGIDTLKQIKRIKPNLAVLILTVHQEENYAINLLRAGASGYLCKECTLRRPGRRHSYGCVWTKICESGTPSPIDRRAERRGAERSTY